MVDGTEPDVVLGRPGVPAALPATEFDYCEFHYVWDSATSQRRRKEFARERPLARYIDLRLVIDGVVIDLSPEDLLRLRNRRVKASR